MGKPITTKGKGICFAFPDVCNTPIPGGSVPIPYPNIGQLADTEGTADKVLVGGEKVVTSNSNIPETTGDEAGSAGNTKGKVKFATYSLTVKIEGNQAVRMFDSTTQNELNAVGQVLGGVPNVLVGD